MKISTSLSHGMDIAGVDCRRSAAMMKEAGFQGVDLSMCHNQMEPEKILSPEWMEKILGENAALRAEGLTLAQCHLPYYPGHLPLPGDGTIQGFSEFMLPGWRRSLQACGEIGCPIAVIHPFFDIGSAEATVEGNLRLIDALMPDLRANHVKLALENIFARDSNAHKNLNSFVSYPEDILRILEKTDPEYVGACIDTGHANIFRIHIGNMARLFGKRLFALHVNGNGGEDEHVIPYGLSAWCERLDFYDFSAALKEIGYQGYYNLEISSGGQPACTAQPFLNYAAAVARALADLAE